MQDSPCETRSASQVLDRVASRFVVVNRRQAASLLQCVRENSACGSFAHEVGNPRSRSEPVLQVITKISHWSLRPRFA